MKEFDQIFGINKTQSEAEQEFVNRVENTIFRFFCGSRENDDYTRNFRAVCFELGKNADNYKFPLSDSYYDLKALSKGNFIETLQVIVALYKIHTRTNPSFMVSMDEWIPDILERSSVKLSIRWHEGMFYPDPIPEIDQYLIDENLQFLNAFPAAKKDLQSALKNYQSGNFTEILDKCYSALEQVAQKLCGIKKPLHDIELKKEIIKSLGVSQRWKDFLNSFIQYANDTSRHGTDPNRHNSDPEEVESYLFLSLIIIRMIIKKIIPGAS